jgi:hypothetical protein
MGPGIRRDNERGGALLFPSPRLRGEGARRADEGRGAEGGAVLQLAPSLRSGPHPAHSRHPLPRNAREREGIAR